MSTASKVSTLEQRVAIIETQVAQLWMRQRKDERTMSGTQSQVDELTQEVTDVDQAVDDLDTHLGDAEKQIAALKAQQVPANLQPLIDTLGQTIGKARTALAQIPAGTDTGTATDAGTPAPASADTPTDTTPPAGV